MTENGIVNNNNGNGLFGYGIGEIGASLSRIYYSIKELHENESLLNNNFTEEDYKALENKLSNVITSLTNRIKTGNQFESFDIASNVVFDVIDKSKTNEAAKRYIKNNYSFTITDSEISQIRKIANEIAKMPRKYFEAKPQRVVRFNEIAYAVVPTDTSEEVLDFFKENNIEVKEYEKGNNEQRKEVINSLPNIIRFSKNLDAKEYTTTEMTDFYNNDDIDSDWNIKTPDSKKFNGRWLGNWFKNLTDLTNYNESSDDAKHYESLAKSADNIAERLNDNYVSYLDMSITDGNPSPEDIKLAKQIYELMDNKHMRETMNKVSDALNDMERGESVEDFIRSLNELADNYKKFRARKLIKLIKSETTSIRFKKAFLNQLQKEFHYSDSALKKAGINKDEILNTTNTQAQAPTQEEEQKLDKAIEEKEKAKLEQAQIKADKAAIKKLDSDLSKKIDDKENELKNYEVGQKDFDKLKKIKHSIKDSKTGKASIPKNEDTKILFDTADDIWDKTNLHLDKITEVFEKVSKKNNISWSFENAQSVQKSKDSIAHRLFRNIFYKYSSSPYNLRDWARTTFIFNENNIKNLSQVIEDLKPYLKGNGEGIQIFNKDGYNGIHLNLIIDGIPVEIQLHTANSWKTKLLQDQYYDKWRIEEAIAQQDPEVAEELYSNEEYKKDMEKSNALGKELKDQDPLFMRLLTSASEILSASFKSNSPSGLDGDTQAPSTSSRIPLKAVERQNTLPLTEDFKNNGSLSSDISSPSNTDTSITQKKVERSKANSQSNENVKSTTLTTSTTSTDNIDKKTQKKQKVKKSIKKASELNVDNPANSDYIPDFTLSDEYQVNFKMINNDLMTAPDNDNQVYEDVGKNNKLPPSPPSDNNNNNDNQGDNDNNNNKKTYTDKDYEPYETDKAKEIVGGAREKEGSFIHVSSIEDLYRNIEKRMSQILDSEYKVKGKGKKTRRLFEEWNILKQDAKLDSVRKFTQDLYNQPIGSKELIGDNESYNFADYLKDHGYNVDEIIEEDAKSFYEVLKDKAITSDTTKKLNKLNKRLTQIIEAFYDAKQEFKATMKFVKNLNTIKNNLKLALKNKVGNTGDLQTNNTGLSALFYDYFKQFSYTNAQYLSMKNIQNLKQMFESGHFEKLVKSLINGNYDLEDIDIQILYDQASAINVIAKDLVDSYSPMQTHMTYQQIQQFTNINKAIYKLFKDANNRMLENTRAKAINLQNRGKELSKKYKVNNLTNIYRKALFDAMSPREIIGFLLGGTNTPEFDYVYNKLYKGSYEAQIDKYVDFLQLRDQFVKETKNKGTKKVRINGKKVYKYTLYQFYLNTLSPDNNIRLQNGHLTYTDKSGTTKRFTYEEMQQAVKDNVSTTEKAELDNLFKLYNTEIKDYVETISEKLYGFKISRDSYYPIVSSKIFKNSNFANPAEMRYNINALENGRLKKLSNQNTSIELNVDPYRLFEDYIESMTITGEIGIPSQELNRLFQLKGPDGESFLSIASQYMPDIKTYFSSVMSKLVANVQTIERSGFMDKVFGKFATATLGFNIRSTMKQFASYFTAWEKVGFTTGLKTMLSPKMWARIIKNRNYLRANNSVFRLRVYDNGYIKGTTLSAGALAFANKGVRSFVKLGLSFMDAMDRFTCYATFNLAQEYVKKTNGYAIGSDENLNLANQMFTDMILQTQSNSDRIAMSRIRSGEKGWLMKNLFGMFQSDSQNKLGLLYNIINDKSNIQNDIKTTKAELAKPSTEGDAELVDSLNDKINKLQKDNTQANKRARAYLAGLVASSLVVTLANMLADWIYDKKEPKDENYVDFLTNLFANATIDWIPYFNQIYNWFEYDEVSIPGVASINEFIEAVKSFTDGDITGADYTNAVMKLLKLFGIPAENLNKLIQGTIGNFNPELAIKYKSLFYSTSQTYLVQQTNSYVESGNLKKARANLSMNYELYKFQIDDDFAEELINLKKAGYSVSVRNKLTSYTNEEGEEVELSEEEQKAFNEIYSQTNEYFKTLKSDSNYQKLSMEDKAKAIKKLTDTMYEVAKYKATGQTPSTKLGKYYAYASSQSTLARTSAIIAYLNSVLADSDNKKSDIVKELNKIGGLSKAEKLFICQMMGYSVSESNNSLLQAYLQRQGLTKAQISEII